MGQGDKPVRYVPKRETVRDDVLGREFASVCMRSCPHPNVIKKYGVGGVANVSVYTCRKCRYVQKHPLHFGVTCRYELELHPGTPS